MDVDSASEAGEFSSDDEDNSRKRPKKQHATSDAQAAIPAAMTEEQQKDIKVIKDTTHQMLQIIGKPKTKRNRATGLSVKLMKGAAYVFFYFFT